MRKNPEDNELLELFEPLRVADVRDGMDWMGYHHYGTLDYRIRPLERTKAVGIAKDVAKYAHRELFNDKNTRKAHFEKLGWELNDSVINDQKVYRG